MTTRKKALLGVGVLCSLMILGLVMQFLLSEEGAAWLGRWRQPEPAASSAALPAGTAEPGVAPAPEPVVALSPEPGEAEEIIGLLRTSYVEAPALLGMNLDEDTLPEFMKQAGAKIALSASPAEAGTRPALMAVLPGNVGYWRAGNLGRQEITGFLEQWSQWKAAGLQGLVLDLRNTGHGIEMSSAADLAGLWINPGIPLFSVQGLNVPQQVFVSERQPLDRPDDFPFVVIVGNETRGAGEMLARVLQRFSPAVIVGQATPGEAGVYVEKKLKSKRFVRCANAGASLPEGGALLGRPLLPDVEVASGAQDAEAMAATRKPEDLAPMIQDKLAKRHPNPRLRSAAEIPPPAADSEDEGQDAKEEKPPKWKDQTLQRAWDVVAGLRAHYRPTAVPAG